MAEIACEPYQEGSISCEFSALTDGDIFVAQTEYGVIKLKIQDDHPVYVSDIVERKMVLDIEDLTTVSDGQWHSCVLTVGKQGTHVYIDGYLAFSGTSPVFLQDLQAGRITYADTTALRVRNMQVTNEILDPQTVVGIARPAQPFVTFAGNSLCDYDCEQVQELQTGTVTARFRVRGVGQGGTILSAGSDTEEKLRLVISADKLVWQVRGKNNAWRTWEAEGDWADGDWHDVAVRSGEGAVDLYVDGFREAHIPGQAFFADCPGITKIMIGQDCFGSRLFGEAAKASIYQHLLTDAQIKRISHIAPLHTVALFDRGLENSISYRIPSLLTLPSGVIIAGADQRTTIANDSPNDINFVTRRSTDGGQTWGLVQTVIEYPGEGRDGASVIDSCSVYDEQTGQVIILIDQYPGGVGQPNNEHGVGMDAQGHLLLHDSDGETYKLLEDGTVQTLDGGETEYHVDEEGNVTRAGKAGGNIYLKDGVDPKQTLLQARTCFLVKITSDDEGQTWSRPEHLNYQVKEEWMAFMGTSPGNGLQIKNGKHAGRLVIPVYYSGDNPKLFSAAVVYSDDHGKTWTRGKSPNDGRIFDGQTIDSRTNQNDAASTHESTLLEKDNGTLVLMMRNQHPSGRVAVCESKDGGQSWSDVTYHPQIPEIFSQPNAIRIPQENGKDWFCFANASQMMPYRGNGVLRLSFDQGKTWPVSRTFNPGHYVYQCMTWLPGGQIGLLWENEWQGLYFTQIPLSWFGGKLGNAAGVITQA